MSRHHRRNTLDHWVTEVFKKGAHHQLGESFHEEVKQHLPMLPTTKTEGHDSVLFQMEAARAGFPDADVVVEDVVDDHEHNKVAVRYKFTGTHTGPFLGIAPTGKKVEFSGIAIYGYHDHKIKEMWSVSDLLTVLTQIGHLQQFTA